jgi:hypothetical protein|uniref:Hydrophobic seed protein domain-containing protein n=1 Tax=Zea mays TaxID=4577 RepID=A0A804UJN8_MAIZE
MAPKVVLFLALGLLFAAAAHGCEPYYPVPVVPTPSVVLTPSSHSHGRYPIDTLKLKVCANVSGLIKVGLPQHEQCCPLLEALVDLNTALCLCTTIKANILGIHLNVPLSLNLILNTTAARFAERTSLAPTKLGIPCVLHLVIAILANKFVTDSFAVPLRILFVWICTLDFNYQ